MTENNKHHGNTDSNETDFIENELNDEFDKQVRATAHKMRERLQPTVEVVEKTTDEAYLQGCQQGDQTANRVSNQSADQATGQVTEQKSDQATGQIAEQVVGKVSGRVTEKDSDRVVSAETTLPPPNGTPLSTIPGGPKKRRHRGRTLGIVAAAAATVLVVGGAFAFNAMNDFQFAPGALTEAGTLATDITSPVSYDELYNSLESKVFDAYSGGAAVDMLSTESAGSVPSTGNRSETAPPPSVESAEVPSADAAAPTSSMDESPSRSYSETNTQVEGVDEADIVKTDGKNIYSLSYDEVIITSAQGKDTEEIARIGIVNGTAQDLYVVDGRLIVMSYDYGWYGINSGNQATYVAIYDISDPSEPQLLNVLGQDGYLNTSRLVDGKLYSVSEYTVYYDYCDPEDPQTFTPNLYDGVEDTDGLSSAAEPMSVDEIYILPEYNSASYTVLTAIDIENAKRMSGISVLGYTDTVYMNEENLFLGATNYNNGPIVPLYEGSESGSTQLRRAPIFPWEIFFFIIDPDAWFENANPQTTYEPPQTSYVPTTRLTRVALNNGYPDIAATTTVEGTLLNQFSLDEYEGYLRVAITVTKDTYAPGEEDVAASTWFGTTTVNSLLVFNSSLSVVGSIEDLAPGERIYSTRFTGDVGYMVTFRQTDPLFSLDLSDPRNPAVMDALKIPGFSQYLHPYADGLLLGLGQNTASSGALTGQLKLSMFDVSDPFAITEANKELIDAYSSDALYNHKAVLIDEEKNIIGFDADREMFSGSAKEEYRYEWKTYYLIYGYDESTGFYERAAIELPDEYEQARALFIDSYLYIVNGENIGVFTLDTLEEVTWVKM